MTVEVTVAAIEIEDLVVARGGRTVLAGLTVMVAGGADPILREELWARFRELTEGGTTVLVSSHVMDEAGRCDRLLLVRGGEVVVDDTPAAVRQRTGSDDLDQAFLTLIRDRERAA